MVDNVCLVLSSSADQLYFRASFVWEAKRQSYQLRTALACLQPAHSAFILGFVKRLSSLMKER